MSTIPSPAKAGLTATRQMLGNVLRSPWFWVAVAIILYVVVRPRLAKWWAKNVSNRTYGGDDSTQSLYVTTPFGRQVNHATPRVQELMRIGDALYDQISGLPAWNDQRPILFRQVTALPNHEVAFLAEYYQQVSGGKTLLDDVSGEWWVIPASAKNDLVTKLRALNL